MPPNEPAPRTLTQMLREWDDDSLARLLTMRPELAFPPPAAFSELAARATTRHAVVEALNGLTAVELTAASATAVLPTPFTVADVVGWAGADPHSEEAAAVESAVEQLRRLALVWGSDSALRPVRVLVGAVETDDVAMASAQRAGLTPPELDGAARQRPALVDKAAAGSAFEFLRRIEVLVEHSDHRPVRLTQARRLAVRDVRALGQMLDLDSSAAQSLLEFAHAAGFVGLSSDGADEVMIPTERFDDWRTRDLAHQWRAIADTWLAQNLGGGPAELKSLLVAAFGDPADGRVLAADDLRSWIQWHRPRRASTWSRFVPTFVAQAGTIGFTGLGAIASFAVDPDARALSDLLPDRVDHVLLQADLTAIAPGPLLPTVAAAFSAFADVESRGGATVFRFTRESLTQAIARGWTADDIVDTLRTRSRTPVPQPLEYLVRDLGRTPADPSMRGPIPGRVTLELDLARRHRSPRRAKPPGDDEDLTPGDRVDEALAHVIVRTLRVNEAVEPASMEHGRYSESLGASAVETIREAVETREVVWLGFVTRSGERRERTINATSVEDGYVHGTDATSAEPVAITLSRVTSAHIIRPAASR